MLAKWRTPPAKIVPAIFGSSTSGSARSASPASRHPSAAEPATSTPSARSPSASFHASPAFTPAAAAHSAGAQHAAGLLQRHQRPPQPRLRLQRRILHSNLHGVSIESAHARAASMPVPAALCGKTRMQTAIVATSTADAA